MRLGLVSRALTAMKTSADIERLLREMLLAAIAEAQPAIRIPAFLPAAPRGRTIVIGAGKASAAMARAFETHWQGPIEGLVVTRYGYAVPCERIDILEAAHPVPDANGVRAAERILQKVSGLSADDLVVCLISGGGSALLALPAQGLTLQVKQDINQALLASGASISDMNCVRRHLSAIKGGHLAAACYPARVVNLLVSDVPSDNPSDIASGPTVPDASTCRDALAVLQRYAINVPPGVTGMLEQGLSETLKPGSSRLPRIETHLIATPQLALEAAARHAEAAGMATHILGDAIEGEAREVGIVMAGIASQVAHRNQPFKAPCILLSGGETTVTIRGTGRGGRNVEFLLSLALALKGKDGIYAIAADTDGVDGQEEIAGALLKPDTLARAQAQGIRPSERLQNNDAHGFFQAIGDSVVTGPTLTNINDFRAILIAPQSGAQ